ncbi:hypothetical protein GYMLUDRAFT_77093 [Collybiopsis luxurians FD-317 M1]|uniref:FAD-binding domain-containing protein n=1 Tax=Collybiopsis luxurians FD-317 M1 TaxID=944289 RepID=A0A0D0C8T4_9AGAR|nr:hypothetical protein GYMLUDRAFT_77093 [Collybiopsis luxurians FD-317 M1]
MTKSTNRVNVLIAGAGPVGLVSALLLLRNGLSVRIIAKESEFRTGYKGPSIQPRTLELYKFLGILDDIWKGSGGPQFVQQYTSPDNGEPPVTAWDFSHPEEIPDKPYPTHRNIGQVDHEAVLRARLLQDYGVQVELNKELVSYKYNSGSNFVLATLLSRMDTGTTSTQETEYDWLIGAEGAHSIVRHQLGCTFVGETLEMGMLLGDIHLLNGWGDDHIKVWGNLAKDYVMLRPYLSAHSTQHSTNTNPKNDTRTQIMLGGSSLDLEKLAELTTNRDALVEMFYSFTGRRDLKFGEMIGATIWRPNIRMVNKLGEGRVYIAGDAAHVHSPTGGQGLNSGIHDAFNLAWKLSLVHKNLAPHTLLDSYTTERVPVIAAMLNVTTDLLKKTFSSGSITSLGPSKLNWTRGSELRMYGINYRGSPIILDEVQPPAEILDPYKMSPNEPVRGGDRAPEAARLRIISPRHRGEMTSLFEIFELTTHTALVFMESRSLQILLRTLNKYPVKTVVIHSNDSDKTLAEQEIDSLHEVVDSEGQAYRVYLQGVEFSATVGSEDQSAVVVLVRPDGHVGAIVKDVDGLERYFKKIFF